MSMSRQELRGVLRQYVSDTLADINTAQEFCQRHPKWQLTMQEELKMMMDIKERMDQCLKSCIWGTIKTFKTPASRLAEVEKDLIPVVNNILEGLDTLGSFLEAVERLAVTALPVFKGEVVRLPEIEINHICNIVAASQYSCQLLIPFKRDQRAFFQPRIQNVESLAFQLKKYIQDTEKICGSVGDSVMNCRTAGIVLPLDQDLSEDDVQRMLLQIRKWNEIRKDQNLRLVVFLNEELRDSFLLVFEEREPRMLDFLNKLEETAVQLDRMLLGSKISSVAGSSVGVVGGALTIAGLALIPVTAGLSLALTMSGLGLGITSGVNTVVTTLTEVGVNKKQKSKANEVFNSFREDMESILGLLENPEEETDWANCTLVAGSVLCGAGAIGKRIDTIIDCASGMKGLKNDDLMISAGKVLAEKGSAVSNVPKMASDLPDVGNAAIKGPLAMSSSARAGFIAVNALFIGVDMFFICKDSISLAKGCESEMAQTIRARAALWGSQVEAWQQVRDSLRRGLEFPEHDRSLLEKPLRLQPEPSAEDQVKQPGCPAQQGR